MPQAQRSGRGPACASAVQVLHRRFDRHRGGEHGTGQVQLLAARQRSDLRDALEDHLLEVGPALDDHQQKPDVAAEDRFAEAGVAVEDRLLERGVVFEGRPVE